MICKLYKDLMMCTFLIGVWIVCGIVTTEEQTSTHTSQPDILQSPEEMFTRLFSERRSEQISAIKGILKYEEPKRQMLVNTITNKIFEVIKSSRVTLENAGFVPGLSKFPENEKIRDALSNILENTSLFGDIVLYMPDIAAPLLAAHNDYEVLLKWGLLFMNQTQLLDKKTVQQMSLVSQELNITERSSDYINPYSRSAKKQVRSQTEAPTPGQKAKKKKKKLPRGPRLSDEL